MTLCIKCEKVCAVYLYLLFFVSAIEVACKQRGNIENLIMRLKKQHVTSDYVTMDTVDRDESKLSIGLDSWKLMYGMVCLRQGSSTF